MRIITVLLVLSASLFAQAPRVGPIVGAGGSSGGSMTWPGGAGVAVYGGSSAWGSSLGLVTTLGNPGVDTNVVSEKAIRTAIAAAISGTITSSTGGQFTIFPSTGTTVAGSPNHLFDGTNVLVKPPIGAGLSGLVVQGLGHTGTDESMISVLHFNPTGYGWRARAIDADGSFQLDLLQGGSWTTGVMNATRSSIALNQPVTVNSTLTVPSSNVAIGTTVLNPTTGVSTPGVTIPTCGSGTYAKADGTGCGTPSGGGAALGGIIDITQSPYSFSTANSAAANATQLTNALAALTSGGEIWIPPAASTYAVGCFTIPNSGGSVPTQVPFRITGFSGTNGYLAQNKGPVLDLRCNTSARILSLGSGTLEIDHLTLINGNTGGGDTVPFILTTNTTLFAHDLTIIGDVTLGAAANIQDAIQLGGGGSTPGNTAGSSWAGYGTQITNVFVDYVKRFLYMHSGPSWTVNGIQVTRNTTWQHTGSNDATNGAQIECSSAGACQGNYFAGNLLEGGPYKWFFYFQKGDYNRIDANPLFDDTLQSGGAFYRFNSGATHNSVMHIFPGLATPMSVGDAGNGNLMMDFTSSPFAISGTMSLGPPANGFVTGAVNIGTNYAGLWPPTATPSGSNYAFAAGLAGDTYLKGATDVYALIGSTIEEHLTSSLKTFSVAVKAAGYQSSDGSAGITGSTCSSFKNGLCVAP